MIRRAATHRCQVTVRDAIYTEVNARMQIIALGLGREFTLARIRITY